MVLVALDEKTTYHQENAYLPIPHRIRHPNHARECTFTTDLLSDKKGHNKGIPQQSLISVCKYHQ